MDIEIRTIAPDEVEAWLQALSVPFGQQLHPEDLKLELLIVEPERTLAAIDDGAIVGGTSVFTSELTIPGAIVPMAGVSTAGVLPTHRRRGVLTTLMRQLLDDVRDRGEKIATLWASEGGIYPRYGFGISTWNTAFGIDPPHAAFRGSVPADGEVRLIPKEEVAEACRPAYERVREVQPGMIGRRPNWWELVLADPEHDRDGFSARFHGVYRAGGEVEGFVLYRVKHDHDEGSDANVLRVEELTAATDRAYAGLWRYVFDVDLVVRVEGEGRSVHEPLLHLLRDPRRLHLQVRDGMWARLVDVPAALAARKYAAEGRLAIAVTDGFCPWNDGVHVLEGGPDGATCERAGNGTEPDLSLDVSTLGAGFLGGNGFRTMARAGLVEEATPGALARADAMFAWDPPPWCPEMF